MGWGLLALEDIPRGAFVCDYVGELITGNKTLQKNTKNALLYYVFCQQNDSKRKEG